MSRPYGRNQGYYDRVRIAYVTQTRFPSEKANGFQIAQVCDALASLGHTVSLLAPTIGNGIKDKASAYYGLPDSFKVVNVRQFDALSAWWVPGKIAFFLSMRSYRKALAKFLKNDRPDLFYARSIEVIEPLLETGVPVVLELHTLPAFRRDRFLALCKRCARVVCLTSPMREALLSWGINPALVVVEPDGVNPGRFSEALDSIASAKQWKLPAARTIVGYVGSLVTQDTIEKGAGELIPAVAELKKRGQVVCGWIVGGPKEWLEKYKAQAKEAGLTDDEFRFHAAVPAASVPSVLAAIDICVYPAPASDHPFFKRDTSPLKLLEYLAAGRPTICADIPPVHDLVGGDAVWFTEPGNPASIADAVTDIFELSADVARKIARGKELVEEHSWTERMKRILEGVRLKKAKAK